MAILVGTDIDCLLLVMKKVVYIEGAHAMDNGDLRKAFSKLFEKELHGNMPKVIMGDGKNQTIDKFHTAPLVQNEQRFLLVDSDAPVDDKAAVCAGFNANQPNGKLKCRLDNTFLMIQEAEAWILSQPEVLNRHNISTAKLSRRNAMEISNPSEMLGLLYKDSGKYYHKVRDFSILLPELDTTKLKECFKEFDELIERLR